MTTNKSPNLQDSYLNQLRKEKDPRSHLSDKRHTA